MKRLITGVLTIILLMFAGDAYSQFVDPNRSGISDDILRVDQSATPKKSVIHQTTPKQKQKSDDRLPKYEIGNEFSDKMKIEYVEVSRNNETGKFELVLNCTNYLSSRSVYIHRAYAEGRSIGQINMETVCFQAPQGKTVEVAIPLCEQLTDISMITIDFCLPFLGYGIAKVVNAPIKWM